MAPKKNKKKVIDYNCIRCDFSTHIKNDMRRHLYERKTVCQGTKNDIELTPEIKENILKNRVYHPPKEKKEPTIVQNIQYNNTINNYIKNMDPLDKLEKYMTYKDIELLCLEEDIENNFSARIDKLEHDKFKYGYNIDENRLFDIIDEISKLRRGDFKQMNIIYDDKLKELNLYKSGSWENFIIDRGIKEVVEMLKDYFLDFYEKYLLKKIHLLEKNEHEKAKYREDMERHYKFLGSFDLIPYVNNKDNMDILGEDDGDFGKYDIEEKWMSKYNAIVYDLKKGEINKIKKNITDILKNNTKRNMKELNQNMIDLLNIDKEFKNTLDLS